MKEPTLIHQQALKYEIEVTEKGHLEFDVPFLPGTHVTVFVLGEVETFDHLLEAAQNNLDFWDHPFDDEDWNNA